MLCLRLIYIAVSQNAQVKEHLCIHQAVQCDAMLDAQIYLVQDTVKAGQHGVQGCKEKQSWHWMAHGCSSPEVVFSNHYCGSILPGAVLKKNTAIILSILSRLLVVVIETVATLFDRFLGMMIRDKFQRAGAYHQRGRGQGPILVMIIQPWTFVSEMRKASSHKSTQWKSRLAWKRFENTLFQAACLQTSTAACWDCLHW